MKIFIGGIRGSGKSTLLDELEDLDKEVVNNAKKLASYHGFSREKLPELSREEKKPLLEELFKEEYADKDDIVVDGHYTVEKGEKEVYPLSVLKQDDFFDKYILVEADSETILERVGEDEKERDYMNRDHLEKHKELEKKYAKEVAEEHGKELKIVNNSSELDEAVNELREEI